MSEILKVSVVQAVYSSETQSKLNNINILTKNSTELPIEVELPRCAGDVKVSDKSNIVPVEEIIYDPSQISVILPK